MKTRTKQILGDFLIWAGGIAVVAGLVILFSGCAAPGEVQVAQKYQQQVFTAYANNNALIFETWAKIYQRKYQAAIDATLEADISAMKQSAPGGTMPVEEIEAGVREMVAQRDRDFASMQTVLELMRKAVATNNLEFNKAMEITEGLNKWMNTGVDATVIDGMTQAVMDIIEGAQK